MFFSFKRSLNLFHEKLRWALSSSEFIFFSFSSHTKSNYLFLYLIHKTFHEFSLFGLICFFVLHLKTFVSVYLAPLVLIQLWICSFLSFFFGYRFCMKNKFSSLSKTFFIFIWLCLLLDGFISVIFWLNLFFSTISK